MRNSQFVTERYVTTVEDSLCAVTKIQIEFQSSVLRTAPLPKEPIAVSAFGYVSLL